MSRAGPYAGQRIALLTQHGKERVMGPLFADALGARLELATGFDTDTLGTFTREVPRPGSQLEAARRKALTGMELLGLDVGVASEGSFGPGPVAFCTWNVELIVLIDRTRGLEIVGRASGPGHHVHAPVRDRLGLDQVAREAGFPGHGLVVRPDDEHDPRVRKGITDRSALYAAFDEAMAASRTSIVFVESELRAHLNPTRMDVIRRATEDLVARADSGCPRCGAPGFWVVERIAGLPCSACGTPTRAPRAERWSCVTGDHVETRDVHPGRLADPFGCDRCNP